MQAKTNDLKKFLGIFENLIFQEYTIKIVQNRILHLQVRMVANRIIRRRTSTEK
jgi:hypothetical protein